MQRSHRSRRILFILLMLTLLTHGSAEPLITQQTSSRVSQRPSGIAAGTAVRVKHGSGWRAGKLAAAFPGTRADTVVLSPCDKCAAERIPAQSITAIQVRVPGSRSGQAIKGGLIGLVAGGITGAALGHATVYEGKSAHLEALGAVLVAPLGLVIGALTGVAIPPHARWATAKLR